MDRFIEVDKLQHTIDEIYLKSNMDRFIVIVAAIPTALAILFKIQYG